MQETQGERLRRARDEIGMKQGHLAKTAHVTQAHLSRIENDESGVTDHTLRRIAAAMGISFDDLVVRKEPHRGEGMVSIDDVLSSESAMVRFLNGERPDRETYDWVRRSLAVIRSEVRRRNDELKDRMLLDPSQRISPGTRKKSDEKKEPSDVSEPSS